MVLSKIVKFSALILIIGLHHYYTHAIEHSADPAIVNSDRYQELCNHCTQYQQKLHHQKMAGQLGGCISHASYLAIERDKEIIRLLLNQLLVELPIEERQAKIEQLIQDLANMA